MAGTSCDARFKVLLVDDEKSALQMYSTLLREDGHPVLMAESGARARELAGAETRLGLVVLDLVLPDVEGLELFRWMRTQRPEVPVIILTGFGSVESAVQALKEGAYHYFTKPPDLEQWRSFVRIALQHRSLEVENRLLRDQLRAGGGERDLVGRSRPMEEVRQWIEVVGPTQATVLIQGESGTGKELAARGIHQSGPRRDGPFVSLNCGALPSQLLESELFGYEKGAFTGAVAAKPGKFEMAHGGTVFLDEVGECTPELQVRLLRVLQEREFQRLGGTRWISSDFRLVAATNRHLEEDVKAGRFRGDLFYRINVIGFTMPPLRERRADIPLLAASFLEKYTRRDAKPLQGIAGAALERLAAHDWPGNVRELENVVERGVVVARGEMIEEADLPPQLRPPGENSLPPELIDRDRPLAEVERAVVASAMVRHGGNKSRVAKILGISRKLLYSKLREYRIEGPADAAGNAK